MDRVTAKPAPPLWWEETPAEAAAADRQWWDRDTDNERNEDQ